MENIINDILNAEETAASLIREAKDKASQMKNDAEIKNKAKLIAAKNEIEKTQQKKIADVKAEHTARYEQTVNSSSEFTNQYKQSHKEKLEMTVKKVFDTIKNVEYNK